MNGAFYIGATGLRAQQDALDVVANNVSNINTQAFKRGEVRFSELMGATADGLTPGGDGLSGVMIDTSHRDYSAGQLKQTGKPLDLAIDGGGFIELLGPGGQTRLWRGGGLMVDRDGFLAASNGMPLKAMISAPADATSLIIKTDGTVSAVSEGEVTPRDIGRIDLAMVKDLTSLTPAGDGLYQISDPADLITVSPGEETAGVVVQGALEQSNVDLTQEMVNLLLMQRTYAANAQVVQAGDQLMSIANNLRR